MNRMLQWILAGFCLAFMTLLLSSYLNQSQNEVTIDSLADGLASETEEVEVEAPVESNTETESKEEESSEEEAPQTSDASSVKDALLARFENNETFVLVAETTYCSYCAIYDEESLSVYQPLKTNATLEQVYLDVDFDGGVEEGLTFFESLGITLEATPTTIWVKNGQIVTMEEGSIALDDLYALNSDYLN